jgi:hypothetical protein
MRAIIAFPIALAFALAPSLVEAGAAEKCMIGDAALCLASPDCHWDADKRGCYPGQAEYQDACAAHTDQNLCDLDTSLGCKWSSSANKCETKTN